MVVVIIHLFIFRVILDLGQMMADLFSLADTLAQLFERIPPAWQLLQLQPNGSCFFERMGWREWRKTMLNQWQTNCLSYLYMLWKSYVRRIRKRQCRKCGINWWGSSKHDHTNPELVLTLGYFPLLGKLLHYRGTYSKRNWDPYNCRVVPVSNTETLLYYIATGLRSENSQAV